LGVYGIMVKEAIEERDVLGVDAAAAAADSHDRRG